MTSLCRRRAIYWLLRSPQTCHAKPKTQPTGAGRYQLLSRWWDAYRKQLGLKDFSPKSQDAVALQQIKERGALPMIDRGDILAGQIDRCSNIWASLPGAGYGQFEHKADSLIAKFRRSGRNGQRDYVWAESPRLFPLWLSASSSACHGLLIITVITPLPTKPSATKMPENWSWRTRQLLTCRCVSVMLLRRCKIHEGVMPMLKLKMMSVMMLPLVVVGCTSKQSVSQCVKHRLRRIMQPPPTGRHCWTGLFPPQREADHYAKTTGRNPEERRMS